MNTILRRFRDNQGYIFKALHVAWPAILESFFVALVAMVDSFMEEVR